MEGACPKPFVNADSLSCPGPAVMSHSPPAAPLLVIEGIDGSGKGTQSRRLAENLKNHQVRCDLLSFPRYEQNFFGARIGDFLNGRFGALAEADPFLVSLLYAGDRFESKPAIEQARQENDLLIFDRYVSSNIGHQAAKRDGEERERMRDWIEHVEYGIFGLPRPDQVILLDIPVARSQELISAKAPRTYTDRQADLQESDTEYLERVRQAYLDLARDDPAWTVIPVCESGRLRSVDEIAAEIMQIATALLGGPGTPGGN